jgi:SAM-dependent methyltransferase
MIPLDLYLHARKKEGRLYSDRIVARLPDIPADHPLVDEWRARAKSANRLAHYVALLPQSHRILELGCGNGWLSHRLASMGGVRVWGLDRGGSELAQACRLFHASNLAFLNADIFRSPFAPHSFDLIVLASVIQYFPDLAALLRALQDLLIPGREIHVLDSPLYNENELASARERTRAYYASLGFPEMADYYFHHTVSSLHPFSPHWLYRPRDWQTRFRRRLGQIMPPFAWFCIR